MKYCLHYNNKNPRLQQADEWIFEYYENNPNLIKKFQAMTEAGLPQRVILDITDFKQEEEIAWDIIGASAKIYPNIAILITKEQVEFIPQMRIRDIKWFFADGCYSVDTLNECLSYGVSDVYVINELGFDIKRVKKICAEKGVSVRVYPNVAQTSARLLTLGDYSSFFLRPEDVSLYEDYVDVLEFFNSYNKENILYDIYTEGEWGGPLELIILNLHTGKQVNNNLIPNLFGESRLECRKKCVYDECHVCNNCVDTIIALQERKKDESINK